MRVLLLGSLPAVHWVDEFLRDQIARASISAEVVVVNETPTRDLLERLTAKAIDTLVLADHEPFGNSIVPLDSALGDAIRAEAQKAVLALELQRQVQRTLHLSRDNFEEWPMLLSDLLGLSGEGVHAPVKLDWASGSGLVDYPLAEKYLGPLFATASKFVEKIELVWPREVFLDADAPGQTLPATVEVAGRARILVYGPYLPLPTGVWHATAYLGFSPDIGKLPFIIEADTGQNISRGFFEVERGGFFSLELEFRVADPMHPVEFRLISQDSALEGQLSLIEITLKQLATS